MSPFRGVSGENVHMEGAIRLILIRPRTGKIMRTRMRMSKKEWTILLRVCGGMFIFPPA
jgi:hypothetical protein